MHGGWHFAFLVWRSLSVGNFEIETSADSLKKNVHSKLLAYPLIKKPPAVFQKQKGNNITPGRECSNEVAYMVLMAYTKRHSKPLSLLYALSVELKLISIRLCARKSNFTELALCLCPFERARLISYDATKE